MVAIHPHAQGRLGDRGATEAEVIATVERGEPFPAKFGRTGFRLEFSGPFPWRGKTFDTKRVEAYSVFEDGDWLVITIIVKYWNA